MIDGYLRGLGIQFTWGRGKRSFFCGEAIASGSWYRRSSFCSCSERVANCTHLSMRTPSEQDCLWR